VQCFFLSQSSIRYSFRREVNSEYTFLNREYQGQKKEINKFRFYISIEISSIKTSVVLWKLLFSKRILTIITNALFAFGVTKTGRLKYIIDHLCILFNYILYSSQFIQILYKFNKRKKQSILLGFFIFV